MSEISRPIAITIRTASSLDADGITRVYMESAEHHAGLEPERYLVPNAGAIAERYREGSQHPADAGEDATTFIAEHAGEIVGFVDVRLTRSPDPMHRGFLYCHILEIAVGTRHRSHGVGEQLMRAAEQWGREHDAEFASLEYLAANVRAGHFYHERMGYRPASVLAVKRL